MPRNSRTPRKSDLSPSALTLDRVRKGKKVLLVDIELGDMEAYTVIEEPFVHEYEGYDDDDDPTFRHLLVGLRNSLGDTVHLFGETLGLIKGYDDEWAPNLFLIDARKRHLFPDYNVVPARTWEEIEEEFWQFAEQEVSDKAEAELYTDWY